MVFLHLNLCKIEDKRSLVVLFWITLILFKSLGDKFWSVLFFNAAERGHLHFLTSAYSYAYTPSRKSKTLGIKIYECSELLFNETVSDFIAFWSFFFFLSQISSTLLLINSFLTNQLKLIFVYQYF